ncbi:MAG: group 1 truncated hemoglobin [Planctomycetaceae bacterium]|nr:group 1 truncated hemoglobin [Planctomycetaceae bacterium]
MTDETRTLFERIGGAESVASLVDAFYGRVLSDPELRPFFENSSVDHLRAIQKEFFAAALDGPVMHSDLDLAHIHQGMGITRAHFSRFVHHLIRVLEQAEMIRPGDAMDVIHRISTYVDDVTGRAGSSGD